MMTKPVFDIDWYDNQTVMLCETEHEGDVFQKYLHSVGREWINGRSYIDPIFVWSPSSPCYRFQRGTRCSLDAFISRGMKILRFSDFDWSYVACEDASEENEDLDSFLSLYHTEQEELT